MTILERLDSPEDLKKLGLEELPQLASEFRDIIVSTCAKNGGHVAPNLGVVELTMALHYAFDSPKDKIVWDVGHQSYTHKLITGRKARFGTLRQYGGMSGFPKKQESEHDHFDTGHASTSISSALGMAEARDLNGESFEVVAVIGDGSLSGGLAFEGLNNTGYLHTNLTIVLNDNKMSIAPNVGALSNHLKMLHRLSDISMEGKPRRRIQTIFEELGFQYYGPIDGHDIGRLIEVFNESKKTKKPKLIHVITQKGRGYLPAERVTEKFHGLGAFDILTGRTTSNNSSFSTVFGKTIVELAEGDQKIVAITAAMTSGTGLKEFAEKFPERFYDVGIAEEHAITFAAGLARGGMKPCLVIYSTFLQRGFDGLIHDVALQCLPVKIFIDRAGLVGDDGPTHHGVFDLGYLRMIPNMVVMSPKDENEFRMMIKTAMEYDRGPVAVRYPKASLIGVPMKAEMTAIRIGEAEIVQEGRGITILAIGTMVQEAIAAAHALDMEGISAEIINARFVKPLDKSKILASVKKTMKLVTVEESVLMGGFGSAVEELLEENGVKADVVRLGVPDEFVEHGASEILKGEMELNAEGIFYHAKYLSRCKTAGMVCNEECRRKNLCMIRVNAREKGTATG
jgi:1-deoxy-D-xylulose-5-phosphate synthase